MQLLKYVNISLVEVNLQNYITIGHELAKVKFLFSDYFGSNV